MELSNANAGLRPLTLGNWVLVAALLLYGLFLRCGDLSAKPFVDDEAESSMNAMTVREHGVPGDRYVGIPVFENTLTIAWPQNAEYEFRDCSYSERGLAVYHGWLPLYAIATAFKIAGIHPDAPAAVPRVQHSIADMRYLTWVARAPSVVFGIIFLLALFLAGRQIHSAEAGWAALAAGVVCLPAVDAARMARYYSLLLAMTMLCVLALSKMLRRGSWRDFIVGGVAVTVLFHTHSMSAVITCGMGALISPYLARIDRGIAKLALFIAIVAVGVLPFVFLSGLANTALHVPSIQSVFDWRKDFLAWPARHAPFAWLAVATFGWILFVQIRSGKIPDRYSRPFLEARRPLLFLMAWTSIGFLAFIFLMPAPSYFFPRMTLTILGPTMLFGAIAISAASRALWPRGAPLMASVALVLLFVAGGKARFWYPAEPVGADSMYTVADSLRRLKITPTTRLYATPNEDLILTLYTGLPIADIAPVRKEFLDAYPGEIVVLGETPYRDRLSPAEVRQMARRLRLPLRDDRVEQLAAVVPLLLTQKDLRGQVREMTPPARAEADPRLLDALIEAQREKSRAGVNREIQVLGNPLFRGFEVRNYDDFWQVFFYRFVNPAARGGKNVNFADRTKEAHAYILPLQWVAYDCPARDAAACIVGKKPRESQPENRFSSKPGNLARTGGGTNSSPAGGIDD